MKNENWAIFSFAAITFLIGVGVGMRSESNKVGEKENLIQLQSDSIQALNKRLQASNEKRGRLFMALLYTDIKGKEAALDSLIIEIGKDN